MGKRIPTGPLKDLTVMLNVSQYSDSYYGGDSNGENNTVSLYFSYPLGTNGSLSASSSYDDRTQQVAPRIDLYGSNDLNTTNYNVAVASYDGVKEPSFSAGINNKQSFGQATLSGSYSSDYQQLNTGFSGSITATRYGIAAHERVYQNQARLFLDTEGASGVIFDEAGNISSNAFGSAVVSNVGAYRKNEQHINENLTKSDVSADSTVIETVLTDGAIGYYQVKTISGSQLLMNISLANGKKPPFGTMIYDTEQQERGIVSDNGMAYVSGVKKDTVLLLKWKKNNCKIMIGSSDYQLDRINEYICR